MTAPRDVYAAICAARDAARSASREPNGGGCAVRRMMMRRSWHDLDRIAVRIEPFVNAGEHHP